MRAAFLIKSTVTFLMIAFVAACAAQRPDTNTKAIDRLNEEIASGQLSGEELAQAFVERGSRLQYKKLYVAAYEDFTAAIKAAPELDVAYARRAWLQRETSDLEGAEADYTQVIDRNLPGIAEAYYNRGETRVALGQLQLAIADFSKAIEVESQFGWAFVRRGEAYLASGEDSLAVLDFTKAINGGRDYFRINPWFSSEVAIFFLALSDVNIVGAKTKSQPVPVAPYVGRGTYWYRQGDYERANADFDTANEIGNLPDDALLLHGLSQLQIGKCRDGYSKLIWWSKKTDSDIEQTIQTHRDFINRTDCSEYNYNLI